MLIRLDLSIQTRSLATAAPAAVAAKAAPAQSASVEIKLVSRQWVVLVYDCYTAYS